MKLSTLLAHYLYINKQLDLEGIGLLQLDDTALVPNQELEKLKKPFLLEGVAFIPDAHRKTPENLITFLAEHSGKMKALLHADLSTHLELMKQFLNIGKPFELEGIGSLQKMSNGQYHFTTGYVTLERLSEVAPKDILNTSISHEVKNNDYNPFLQERKTTQQWKKPLLGVVLIAVLGGLIYGGFSLYQSSKNKKTEDTSSLSTHTSPVQETETNATPTNFPAIDTINTVIATTNKYKFVFEKLDSSRAYSRFNKLKEYGWAIEIEKHDSAMYQLFMQLPTQDTLRAVDSLRIVYGKKPWIEL